jgi:hypothetical protein
MNKSHKLANFMTFVRDLFSERLFARPVIITASRKFPVAVISGSGIQPAGSHRPQSCEERFSFIATLCSLKRINE